MPDNFVPARPGSDDLVHQSEWRTCACGAQIRVTPGLSLIEQFEGEIQVMWAVEKFHCYFCGCFGWLDISNRQPARQYKLMIMTAEGLGGSQPPPVVRRGLLGRLWRWLFGGKIKE